MNIEEIKDPKTVLEEAINSFVHSEKAITKIRVKLEDKQKLTDDETKLNMAILDSELEEIKILKLSIIKLYKPYKEK